MDSSYLEKATEVRKEWSMVCDTVAHYKPVFIKRTRDEFFMVNVNTLKELLRAYDFHAEKYVEDDGSVTLSLDEIDLAENGPDEALARFELGKAILEYASDYYNEYALYSKAPNRAGHVPYVLKAIIIGNAETIGKSVICRDGKN